MKTTSLDKAIEKQIGKIGTPDRDRFEAELAAEIKMVKRRNYLLFKIKGRERSGGMSRFAPPFEVRKRS